MKEKRILFILFFLILAMLTVYAGAEAPRYPYGVFLSINEDLEQFADYEIVVIDAQYFSKEEIEDFRSKGHRIFTYINIGSLEDFRDYYEE